MCARTVLRVVALTMAIIAAAATAVSANRISVDDQDWTATWTEVEIVVTEFGAIYCAVTLAGSFHSPTVQKVSGALIGSITGASMSECGGGTATFLTGTLPWHLLYDSFGGTLPNISSMRVEAIGMSFQTAFFATCLFRTTLAEPAGISLEVTSGQIGPASFVSDWVIDGTDTSGTLCDNWGMTHTLAGAGTVADSPVTSTPTAQFTPGGEAALDSLGQIAFTGGELRMACEWTLTGSLRREAVTLTEGAVLGSVSSVAADRCGGGRVERALSTPWDIKYVRATGTLPGSVTALTLKVENYAVDLKTFGPRVGCLYRGDLTGTLELSGANPYPTGLFRLSEPRLSFVSGERSCPASIVASGTFWLGPEQEVRFGSFESGGNPLALTLI